MMAPTRDTKQASAQRRELMFAMLLVSLYLSQRVAPAATSQEALGGKTSFVSSSSSSGSSKANELGATSKFRQQIVQLQRKQQQKQQQQQVIEQQRQQQVVEQHQQVFEQQQQQQAIQEQRVAVEQSIDSQQQQVKEEQQQQQQVTEQTTSYQGSIRGTPGVDFPAYASIPNTKFSCAGAPFDPGMYADETTACQVYHMCYQGRRESFLCGVGTVFNQAIMNCDHWHSVDCARSSQYYKLNADFGKSSPEPASGSSGSSFFQQQRVIQQQAQLPPVRQQQHTAQVDEQSSREFSAGATKRGGAPASSFRRDFQQFSAQRRPVSPDRRVTQLQSASAEFSQSAESSPIARSIESTAAGSATKSGDQVGSSLLVVADADESKGATLPTALKATKGAKASFASQKVKTTQQAVVKSSSSSSGSVKQSSGSSVKSSNQLVDETNNDVWKPYFKSKTKNVASSSVTTSSSSSSKTASKGGGGGGRQQQHPEWPPLMGPRSTTTPAPGPGASSPGPTAVSTLAQPDQEPNFGPNGSAPASEAPAKIPKSSPPPEAETTTPALTTTTTTSTSSPTSDQTTTASSAAIEPDVGLALSPTTPAAAEEATAAPAAPTEAPTTTTPAPTTTTTTTTTTTAEPASSAPTSESPAQATTSPEPVAQPDGASASVTTTESPTTTTTSFTTTTTTTTTAVPTTASPGSLEADSVTPGEEGEREANSGEVRKKKRGTLTAGVEYARDSRKKAPRIRTPKSATATPATTATRANSSSVEYAEELSKAAQ